MNFKLRCCSCGTVYWRVGEDEPDVNAHAITDKRGDNCPDCGGDNYIIIDSEDPADDEL